jgi:hypothetical protein
LFWPVGYLAALEGVLAAARLRPAWLAASVLVVAAGLQVADATSLRNAVHNLARTPFPWAVDADRLRAQLAASRHVTLLPAAGCGASLTVDDSWLQVVLLASERVRPINTMYLSRRTRLPTDCDAEGYVPLDDGELRVYVPPAVAAPFALPDRGRDCRVLGRIAVCSKADALLAGLPVVPAPDVTIPLGVTLSAGADGDPRPLLWGWSISVPGGTWSEGPSASIAGRLAGPPVAPLELTLAGMPYAPDGTAEGRVTVLLNERPLAVWPVRHLQAAVFHAALPPDVDLAAPFAIRLEFAPLPSGAPRHWRLWLTSLRIAAAG